METQDKTREAPEKMKQHTIYFGRPVIDYPSGHHTIDDYRHLINHPEGRVAIDTCLRIHNYSGHVDDGFYGAAQDSPIECFCHLFASQLRENGHYRLEDCSIVNGMTIPRLLAPGESYLHGSAKELVPCPPMPESSVESYKASINRWIRHKGFVADCWSRISNGGGRGDMTHEDLEEIYRFGLSLGGRTAEDIKEIQEIRKRSRAK